MGIVEELKKMSPRLLQGLKLHLKSWIKKDVLHKYAKLSSEVLDISFDLHATKEVLRELEKQNTTLEKRIVSLESNITSNIIEVNGIKYKRCDCD